MMILRSILVSLFLLCLYSSCTKDNLTEPTPIDEPNPIVIISPYAHLEGIFYTQYTTIDGYASSASYYNRNVDADRYFTIRTDSSHLTVAGFPIPIDSSTQTVFTFLGPDPFGGPSAPTIRVHVVFNATYDSISVDYDNNYTAGATSTTIRYTGIRQHQQWAPLNRQTYRLQVTEQTFQTGVDTQYTANIPIEYFYYRREPALLGYETTTFNLDGQSFLTGMFFSTYKETKRTNMEDVEQEVYWMGDSIFIERTHIIKQSYLNMVAPDTIYYSCSGRVL